MPPTKCHSLGIPAPIPQATMLHLRALALQILAQHGWFVPENPLNGDCAIKTFRSAVGPKAASASVYLSSREPYLHLTGTFYSEGSNALAADLALIPTDCPRERFERIVRAWIAAAEKSIAGTYAVRLRDPAADLLPGPVAA